jgi:hypothetical protein
MELRSLAPGSFPGRQDRRTESAARVAVREFFPVLLVLVAVDVSTDGTVLGALTVVPNLSEQVPAAVYVYAFLGAGAYAVTSLAFSPKESIVETYRLTYRMVGALPLGAGVYVLATQLGVSEVTAPVAGVAFLSGLYVRLALRRLGDLAEKLYGAEDDVRQPFEAERRRRVTNANLRRCWRHVATTDLPPDDRRTAVGLLERAGAITDDEDATRQELARAHELSERALEELGLSGDGGDAGGGPTGDRATADGRSGDGDGERVDGREDGRDSERTGAGGAATGG